MSKRIPVILIPTFLFLVVIGTAPIANALNEPVPTSQSASPTSQAAEETDAGPIPTSRVHVDEADAMLLAHYARRAIRSGFKGAGMGGEPYVPPSLEGKSGIVHATLWRDGVRMATGESGRMPVVQATIAAAMEAGKSLQANHSNDANGCADCGLELEWMGPPEPIAPPYYGKGATWTPGLIGAIVPGIQAVGVTYDGKTAITPASAVIEHDFSPDYMLMLAERKVGLGNDVKETHPEKVHYFRCDTHELWQANAKAKPVQLLRGEPLVPPGAVTRKGLDGAIKQTGDYLLYRQNSNGAFSHEYVPSADRYSNESVALVQLRALYGLARLAAERKDQKTEQGAENGIMAFSRYLEDLNFQIKTQQGSKVAPGGGRILYIPGHENHLESTAYLVLAMSVLPDRAKYEPEMKGLTTTLLYAELSDGSMRLILGKAPEGPPTAKEDRAGATALAALAQRYGLTKDANIKAVMLETLGYYSSRQNDLSADAAAWLTRAYAQQYIQTEQPRYEKFVFAMADRFAALQLTPETCEYPELWGAIAPSMSISAEAKTALYVSAIADALRVARRVGDMDRAERYERAVSLGARFIMQLEFSETGAYYVRSKMDVLGGIRTKPWDATIRVDHCAFGVGALIDARATLFAN